MKKLIKITVVIMALLCAMYAEYRFIMLNIRPYRGENGTVYLEIFERVDEYYADPVSEMKGE